MNLSINGKKEAQQSKCGVESTHSILVQNGFMPDINHDGRKLSLQEGELEEVEDDYEFDAVEDDLDDSDEDGA